MDPSTYDWGNMLPSPIPYNTEPDINASHLGSVEQTTSMSSSGPSRNPLNHASSTNEAMDVDAAQVASQVSAGGPRQSQPATTRRRNRDQDWEQYKELLHQLYIEQGNSLAEVMKRMQQEHGFGPTQKQYKDKFKSWKWIKHLPGEVAQWMVEKANVRQAEDGRETLFNFKGQMWTKEQAQHSAHRTRKVILVETPSDMDWETPRNLGDHNSPAAHRPLINLPEEEPGVVTPEPPAVRRTFPLTWKGKNRANLVQVLETARDSYHHQDFDRAETDFLEALDGHRFLLTPTHEETVKIAYEIANFYAEQGRINKANEMLEEVSADFIERWGVGHKKTYQHGLNMVDFLQTWGREDDALALIAHARDAYERAMDESELESRVTPGKRKRIRETPSSNRLQSIRNGITGNPSSSRIDHGLGTARSYVANGEPGVEDLLKSIEEVCARDRQSYAIQGVQARAELLKLYNQRDVASQHTNVYTSARQLLELSWSQFPWDKEKIRSLDLVEASLELASGLLRSGVVDSNWMFRKIEDQATNLFGFDDERTIWTLISIGLIHQTWQGWNVARRWFEQALAAALSVYDHTDGIVRSLEAARDNKYFSYISDEGRPFDTVFGVNGLTIRPRRLHLE